LGLEDHQRTEARKIGGRGKIPKKGSGHWNGSVELALMRYLAG